MKLIIRIALTALICGGAFLLVAKKSSRHVSVLLVDGNVRTLDAVNSRSTAIAILGGRIVETGGDDDLRARYTADTVIDLKGMTVLPGLIDGHAHMFGLGQLLQSVNLVGIGSAEEAVERVRERVQTVPKGEWVYGRGWDQNLWKTKEFPTADMLESVSPDYPVILIRIDGHAIWVNRRAMELAHITRDTRDPDGGKIVRASDGTPTGVFLDNARDLVEQFVPPESPTDIERSILLAVSECVKNGLTEVYDMGIDSVELAVYRKLVDEHRLPLRIYAAIGAPSASWDRLKNSPPLIGYGNGMLTARAMKMYVDGALGSRGAALVEQYSDDPGNRGLTINEKSLEPEARIAFRNGYQVCVHAIGDRGNHIVLDCFDKLIKELPAGDYRPRIEHAQVLLPDDIGRFALLKVLPSMQPVHATSDMYWAEARLGPERIRNAYAWRSLLKTGTPIVGGSDFPNDVLSPLRGFYAAVTRSGPDGYPEDGWYRDQCMTRDEAGRCYTNWAAYGGFQESWKGIIGPGMAADLTVLSADIFEIPANQILSTTVTMTIVNGRTVYQADQVKKPS